MYVCSKVMHNAKLIKGDQSSNLVINDVIGITISVLFFLWKIHDRKRITMKVSVSYGRLITDNRLMKI